jgi:V/A-type H+/Na+-transporting ATPase subunit F
MEAKLNPKYKIATVSTEELSLGFRIAGVKDSIIVDNGTDAEEAIRNLLQRTDIGLIVVSTGVTKMIKDRKVMNAIDTSLMPMFIEVPEYKEEYKQDTLRRLILRAIGIDISKTIGS